MSHTTGTNGTSVLWSQSQQPLVEIVPLSDEGRKLVPTLAAAAELLAAAKGVDELYAAMQAALPDLVGTKSMDVVQQAVSRARAAIAKATEGSR